MSCARFLLLSVSYLMILYSTIVSLVSLFSNQWYQNPSLGIATGASFNIALGEYTFQLGDLQNSYERATAGLLITSFCLGVLTLIVLAISICCCCCCDGAPIAGFLAFLQFAVLFSACITFGYYYDFKMPVSTQSLGYAWIIIIIATVLSFFTIFTLILDHKLYRGDKRNSRGGKQVEA